MKNKVLVTIVVGVSVSASAFARPKYYVDCRESWISPDSGRVLYVPEARENPKELRTIEVYENETKKIVSRLNNKFKYYITTQGRYLDQFGGQGLLNPNNAVQSPVLSRYSFGTLFGQWQGNSGRLPARAAKASKAPKGQEPVEPNKQQALDPNSQLPLNPNDQELQPKLSQTIPAGAFYTEKGDLNIRPMYRSRVFKHSRDLPQQPGLATVLNWSESLSKTVLVFPAGPGTALKLECDKHQAN